MESDPFLPEDRIGRGRPKCDQISISDSNTIIMRVDLQNISFENITNGRGRHLGLMFAEHIILLQSGFWCSQGCVCM